MSNVQKPTMAQALKRRARTPLLLVRHFISRANLYWRLLCAMEDHRQVEASIQKLKQSFNELQMEKQLREQQVSEFHYLRGYIDGIEFCIRGEWRKNA